MELDKEGGRLHQANRRGSGRPETQLTIARNMAASGTGAGGREEMSGNECGGGC